MSDRQNNMPKNIYCSVCSKYENCRNLCASLEAHLKDCEFSDGRLVYLDFVGQAVKDQAGCYVRADSQFETAARPRMPYDSAQSKHAVCFCASLIQNTCPENLDIATLFPFLTSQQNEYLELKFLKNHTIREIGKIKGVSHQSVCRVLDRAKHQIEKQQGGCQIAYSKRVNRYFF